MGGSSKPYENREIPSATAAPSDKASAMATGWRMVLADVCAGAAGVGVVGVVGVGVGVSAVMACLEGIVMLFMLERLSRICNKHPN